MWLMAMWIREKEGQDEILASEHSVGGEGDEGRSRELHLCEIY